jgi:hypothetical protein
MSFSVALLRSRVTRLVAVLTALAVLALPRVPGPAAAAPTPTGTATVELSGTAPRAVLDRPLPLTGSVADADGRPLAGVSLVVEVGTPRGWARTPATTVSDRLGGFRVGAPTFFYGRHVFRVSAPALGAASAAQSVVVPVPYRPAGRAGSWRVDATRFDPCAPIPFRVNPAGAPRNALALVRAALAKARAATGLTFVYAGPYGGVPFSRSGAGLPAEGIGFAWATPRQVPALAGAAIGLGGGGWSTGERRLSSGVVIDRTFRLRAGWRRANSVGGLLLHEIGHALGLEHVGDRHQQMYPRDVGTRTGDYNRGDLTALRRLGLEGGCVAGPPVSRTSAAPVSASPRS